MEVAGSSGRATARDYVVLHLIVLAWGITAVLGKLIHLTPLVLMMWRTGLAALTLLLVLGWQRVRWPAWREMVVMLATGGLIGLHWFLFFLSGRLGTVSGSLAGVSTMALWVAFLEPVLVRGRRWRASEAALAIGVSAGVMVIQFSDQGLLTGILAAGVAAVFSIINGRLVQRYPALIITALEMTGACALGLAGAWFFPGSGDTGWWPATADWPWVLTLALVCTVFAYSACVWVQQRISPFSVGMASNLEPVYGMVLAPLVFGAGEQQSLRFYLGTAVILGCVVLHGFLTARQAGKPS